MSAKNSLVWIILTAGLLLLFFMDLSMGSLNISFGEILSILTFQENRDSVHSSIVWDFRMTKALTCVLAGSALSLGGLQMQTLFRNPLVGPDMLGLTSGASLAVALIFMANAAGFHALAFDTPMVVAIAASIGCAGVFLLMLVFSKRVSDNVSLLIIGLMVGAGASSIVSVLQFLSKAEEMQVFIIWTFGSLGGLSWSEIQVLTVILLLGTVMAVLQIKSLNAWMLGDRYALSLGIDIKRSRMYFILSASILTGGVTAFCGPIAFVGLAVPHLVKLLIKSSSHKALIPAVIIGGSALLLFCDILAQLPKTYILPINAITAMIGAPVVIWVILRNRKVYI
jgi:iron complex transport system permease protein